MASTTSEPSSTAPPPKQYVTPDELLLYSYRLGRAIIDSGYRPDWIVALWRGGTPIGIAVQEFLAYNGIHANHISIRTSSYKKALEPGAVEVKVFGLHYLVEAANNTDKLLFIDDIFDSGRSIDAVITTLRTLMRCNMPSQVRVAVPFYKPTHNVTTRIPDYYLFETDKWIVFPHELDGLTDEEIKQLKGPEIYALLHPKSSS
ncbi:hypoxanthine phosphoribosyltransferase [Pelomyxa schiedti]|nr:hypoxanthine phosphoribosyltransferase [Pelomyxa schiedti]